MLAALGRNLLPVSAPGDGDLAVGLGPPDSILYPPSPRFSVAGGYLGNHTAGASRWRQSMVVDKWSKPSRGLERLQHKTRSLRRFLADAPAARSASSGPATTRFQGLGAVARFRFKWAVAPIFVS